MKPSPASSLEEIDSEVARLVSSGIHIPPQPRIVLDVMSMARAKHFDLRTMAHLISQDAGLTSMLYKITRLAAFSRSRPPQSIEQILTLVGMRQTAALVQSYGVTTALKGKNLAMESFWSRSKAIAQLSSLVCHQLNQNGAISRITPEQAYMAGIFHDCGVPVLMQRFPDYCKATGAGIGDAWVDVNAEDNVFQVDHCSIGYLLARHWRLPDFVADAILYHHEIRRLETSVARSMVAMLQLAIFLYAQEHGLSNPDWKYVSGTVLDELGIHADDLAEFVDGIFDMFDSAQAS